MIEDHLTDKETEQAENGESIYIPIPETVELRLKPKRKRNKDKIRLNRVRLIGFKGRNTMKKKLKKKSCTRCLQLQHLQSVRYAKIYVQEK